MKAIVLLSILCIASAALAVGQNCGGLAKEEKKKCLEALAEKSKKRPGQDCSGLAPEHKKKCLEALA